MYEQKNDEELVSLIVSGDRKAMDYLMDKYKTLVRSRARTLYLVGADKEDLIQEGMIGLYKAIRDFDAQKMVSFRHFAELCINRQMYSAIKGSNTQKNQPLNNYVSIDSMVTDDGREGTVEKLMSTGFEKNNNPEQLVLDKERADVIECTLVGHLSNMEREVLFYYLKDYNYNQIAAAVGKEVKAVDNALQRIKKKLTQVLHDLA